MSDATSVRYAGPRKYKLSKKPKLPVVQVNPFMTERDGTWYKDMSLPEFYEKPDVMTSNTEAFIKPPPTAFSTSIDSFLTARENRPILPLAQLNKPNTEAPNLLTTQNSIPVKVKLIEIPTPVDSTKEKKNGFSTTPRTECISPESPLKQLPKHGFAPTISDREKKTASESHIIKPTSLLNRERTDDFVSKYQVLRLRGSKLLDGSLAPAPSTYFGKAGQAPMKSLEEFYRHLITSYNRGYAFSPTKSRMTSLSCPPALESISKKSDELLVSLNNESLSSRLAQHLGSVESKSALNIIQSAGKPTHVEQKIIRDYSLFTEMSRQGQTAANGYHFTRYLKLKNYNPTQGELFLMLNKEHNRTNKKVSKSLPNNLSSRQTVDERTESWIMSTDDQDIPVSPFTANATNEAGYLKEAEPDNPSKVYEISIPEVTEDMDCEPKTYRTNEDLESKPQDALPEGIDITSVDNSVL